MLASLAAAALLTVSVVAEEPQAAAPAPTEAKAADAKPAEPAAKAVEPAKPAAAKPAVEEAKWEVKAETKGVTVHSRPKAGSDIKELKTTGEIDSPPPAVFRVLTDLEAYKETMPYTEESKVIETEDVNGKKAWHFYSLINAPLASRRDYTIKIEDQSDWQDGKGYLKTYWDISAKGPEPKKGVVRVKVNQGSWMLEPVDGGKKTKATYLLFTDPGGSLPTWIANKANSSAIPDIFVQLRKLSKEPKYADGKK
ncbi:MAG TPA: START domain-containing protein [Myxococcales bacterium]|jgi:hypothetical protein